MNKEAIVVVLDVNCTMMKHLRKEQGNPEQRIKTAKDSIRMLLEQKLLHNPKHEFGLVLFGTSATSNALNDSMGDDQYTNVVTDRQLSHIDLEFFRSVQAIEAEETEQPKGDMLDGLIVGMDMLCKFVGTKKYKKRIFLITDGEKETSCTQNEMRDIVRTIKENEIKLNCITLDFCNEIGEEDDDEEENEVTKQSTAQKDENETEAQGKNKQLLLEMQEQTGCAIIPAETAIELYRQFKKKEYLTRAKFKGNLEISGDLNIAVQMFAKTREETLPSLKRYSKNVPENNQVDAGKVSIEKTFTEIDDPDQKEVDTQDHAKAYYYGKQLVPVSEEYENFLKPQPKKKKEEDGSQTPRSENDIKMEQDGIPKQFKLLGFSNQSNVPRHHFMGGVDVILPVKGAKNERAFAAMVYAMIDTHKVLLAKIIERKNADPKLVVLYPHISKKQPILYLVQLPTSEDIRDYQFPKLVKATQKQREAAAKLIDKLDLCQEDEDGDQVERLDPEETFNPTIQYFNQVVTHKVVNPHEADQIPPLNPAIREYMEPDQQVMENAAQEIEEFDAAFDIVQNEEEEGQNEKKQRVYWRDIIAREEEQLVEEQQQQQQVLPEIMTEEQAARLKDKGPDDEDPDAVKQVGSVNPIQDFKKMISDRKVDRVNEAIRQIQSIIERYVRCSLSGDLYEKAFECLKHLREACVKEDEAPAFNRFLERVKDQFGNGAHRAFFEMLVQNKLSLITNDESNISSTVTPAESRDFLRVQIQRPTQKQEDKQQKKEDDDFDLIE